MPRSRELQKIYDELGAEGYKEYQRNKTNNHNKEEYHKNPEKFITKARNWRDDNPEKLKEVYKRVDDKRAGTPSRIKHTIIASWIFHQITFGDMDIDKFYDEFCEKEYCDSCYVKFDNIIPENKKQLDHIHKPLFCNIRGIICWGCNNNDNWWYRMKDDSIYQNYLEQLKIDFER